MKRFRTTSLVFVAALTVALASCKHDSKEPVDYVDPYIGNISHMLMPTYPTVHLPNSLVRVYPQRADYTGELLNGLPVVLLSHRGSFMFGINPTQLPVEEIPRTIQYSYDNEHITPYRYSVYLDEVDIEVDYAPSHQSAVYNFTFPDGGSKVVINTGNGEFEINPDGSVQGIQNFGRGTFYLYVEAEQKPVFSSLRPADPNSRSRAASVVLDFGKQKSVNLRYGVSLISAQQAKANLRREIGTYSVDQVAVAGRKIWNETLGKIKVEGGEKDKTIFYTSLYRTYERMLNTSEDGRYFSPFNGQVMDDNGIPFYNDDWIWDTYRATHPLRVIIEPEMEGNMINSYIRMAQQTSEGWLPTFPQINGDQHCMNGNHSIAVIIDAWTKGIRGFDLEAAYEAAKGTLTEKSLLPWVRAPYTDLDRFYDENGWYPALDPGEPETNPTVHSWERRQTICVTLGTCYDDWCMAQIVKELGKEDDYKWFMNRSQYYRNSFNYETGFFHPRNAGGEFITPLDYRFDGGPGGRNYYDENNGWIFRWDVQHNFADLVEMMGGPEKFSANLDALFRTPLGKSRYEFYAVFPDHTGNVGQFSMGNEPCLHIPYLYNYAGQPWKTQKRIREVLDQWFRDDLMGIPGDEDGGGMTAFVVFSQLGFYPVTPGSATYNIGSPVFGRSEINVGNGKTFVIEAKNCSRDNKYIQSATLNGKPWNKPWFSHSDIAGGGKLVLVMGPKANREWGSDLADVPPSASVFRD